jgi:hypothetical protein
MTKKVRNCIICSAPTVADNRLCKRRECHIERQKRRIIPVPDDELPPKSGSFMSLRNCTHGIPLEGECFRCDDEWQNVIQDIDVASDDLPSNPRIRLK